jgi:hypothetical protein
MTDTHWFRSIRSVSGFLPTVAMALSLLAGCSQQTEESTVDEPLLSVAPKDSLALPPLSDAEAARAVATLPHGLTKSPGKPKSNTQKPLAATPRFQRGEQFPVIRTVTQTLNQISAEGATKGTSRLEANMMLVAEETRQDGRSRLGVQFERLRYTRELAGDRFTYDSTQPPGQVPTDVLPYQGLAGNRFSLWVGHDNQIQELVGFADFIERSLRSMPQAGRVTLASRFESLPPDEIVAEFLDESVGLLQDDSATRGESASSIRVGGGWSRTRTFTIPVPHHVSTRYSIAACNKQIVEIEVLGTITAAKDAAAKAAVVIHRGHVVGRCRIDRRTGLPMDSQIEQRLEMHIPTADGRNIEQEKIVVSTFRVGLPGPTAQGHGPNAN